MFMGISTDNWALLWSGIGGAIIAGGSAGIVAMVVLRRTNAHQSKLAQEESEKQDFRAKDQLDQQREALELQLADQRKQTQVARRLDALADVSANLQAITVNRVAGGSMLPEMTTALVAAITRWRLNGGSDGVANALSQFAAAITAAKVHLLGNDFHPERYSAPEVVVANSTQAINRLLVDLANEKASDEDLASAITAVRVKAEAELEQLGVPVTPGWTTADQGV